MPTEQRCCETDEQDPARSMLIGAGLGGGFWVEAISSASYIRNKGAGGRTQQDARGAMVGEDPNGETLKGLREESLCVL